MIKELGQKIVGTIDELDKTDSQKGVCRLFVRTDNDKLVVVRYLSRKSEFFKFLNEIDNQRYISGDLSNNPLKNYKVQLYVYKNEGYIEPAE